MYDKISLIIIVLALFLIIFNAISQLKNGIKRINFTLDKIANKIGLPEPFEDNEIKIFIKNGEKIKAIKRYRQITCSGLKEASDYIEQLISKQKIKR